jgi:hypothetical protein
MKHEYHEGPKAGENFERLARVVFQAPKVTSSPKKQTQIRNESDKSYIGKTARLSVCWIGTFVKFALG